MPSADRWKSFLPGDGYELLAADVSDKRLDGLANEDRVSALSDPEYTWNTRQSFRPHAMILSGDHIVIADPPDILDTADPFGPFEGRNGGVLRVIDRKTGDVSQELRLKDMPRTDGLASADDRLFVVTSNGKLLCYNSLGLKFPYGLDVRVGEDKGPTRYVDLLEAGVQEIE